MTVPVTDKRDGYRAEVDRAVAEFAVDHLWSLAQESKARRICYRTVWTETDWRNLANPDVPESLLVIPNDGLGTDHNSTGLYQQRQPWWDSVIGSMDPYTATVRYLQHMLRNCPNWFTDDESTVCQNVQQSQYDGVTIDLKTGLAYPFAANYQARSAQTDAVEADPLYFLHHPAKG